MQEKTAHFLDALSPGATRFQFQTFDDNKERKAPNLTWQGWSVYGDAEAYLRRCNKAGGGVFFSVQETNGGGCAAADVTGLRALFVDSDTVREAPLAVPVPPSARVQSSPGREHIYWFLHPGEDKERFRNAQQQLARYLDTDPSVCNVNRVMRLPGFDHMKTGTGYPVTVTELHQDRRYTIDEVLAGFEGENQTTISHYAEWRMRGVLDKLSNTAEGGRNNALYGAAFIAKDLVAAGALDKARTICDLTEAGTKAGLTPKEIENTIRSAFKTDAKSDVASRLLNPVDAAASAPITRQHDLDIARHLAKRLGGDDGHLKVVDGSLYRYDPKGVWAEVDLSHLRGIVQKYHGAIVYTEKGTEVEINITQRKRDGIIDLLLHEEELQAPDFWRGATPGVLFNNGFVSPLINGDLEPRAPSPDFRCRTMIDVDFDINERAPRWEKFLHELFPQHKTSIRILQEIAGGAMLGMSTGFGKCAVLLGDGANGKSVLLRALTQNLFTRQLVSYVPPGKWGQEYYAAKMESSVWNVVGELPAWNIVSSETFKSVVTGDEIMGRHIYGRPFHFEPRAAQVFACNALPSTKDYSDGFWRRFLVIPFEARFDGTRSADSILSELGEERAGIVAWAMIGAIRLVSQKGYSRSEQTDSAHAEWRRDVDPVLSFLSCCTDDGETRAMELYSQFRQWCELAGRPTPSSKTFGQRLRVAGITKRRKSDGFYYLVGIRPVSMWELEA